MTCSHLGDESLTGGRLADRMTISKRQKLVGLAVAGAAVLGAGATALAQTSTTSPPPAAAVAPTTAAPATPSTTASSAAEADRRLPVRRLRRAVHGDLVVRGKGDTYVPITFDRGKVTAASATSISLERPDGVAVTVSIGSSTTFRGIDSATGLRVGDPAVVTSAGNVATVIAQRKAG